MLQVFVSQAWSSKEDNLEFFALWNNPGKWRDFLIRFFLSGWAQLMESIGGSWDWIACFELLRVDRVPVEEEICDGAVIFGKVLDEGVNLRDGETIVAESKM